MCAVLHSLVCMSSSVYSENMCIPRMCVFRTSAQVLMNAPHAPHPHFILYSTYTFNMFFPFYAWFRLAVVRWRDVCKKDKQGVPRPLPSHIIGEVNSLIIQPWFRLEIYYLQLSNVSWIIIYNYKTWVSFQNSQLSNMSWIVTIINYQNSQLSEFTIIRIHNYQLPQNFKKPSCI